MTPIRKRALTLAALLVAALSSYIAGAAVFIGLFVAGLVLELLFWFGLLFTDWKGLRKASVDLPAQH